MNETIVVIGGSAGALVAIRQIVAALPPAFSPAVVVCIHYPDDAPSSLARILERSGPLPARTLRGNELLEPGTIGVAPPGWQVVVSRHATHLELVSRESGRRPSIDVLFRSAAVAFGEQATGVVVSGLLDDGTRGLAEIVRRGGRAFAQTPRDAEFDSMPASAIGHVDGIEIASAEEIGLRLAAAARPTSGHRLAERAGVAAPADLDTRSEPYERSESRRFDTPELDDAGPPRSASALRTAIRAHDDRVAVLTRLRAGARARGDSGAERIYARLATEAGDRASRLRAVPSL